MLKTNYITESELPLLQEWRKDPSDWKKINYDNIQHGPEVLVENLTAKQLFNKLSNLTNLKEIIPSNIDKL